MRIVVTGAAGFIGSSLCEYLQSHGIEHIGIDNFAYGYRDNVFDSEGSPKFNFTEMDACSADMCNVITCGDIVVHLAAVSSLPENQSHPVKSFHNNNLSTINMLEISRKNNASHFILASTSAIYEKSETFPCSESDTIIQPTLMYSLGKHHCEDYCRAFTHAYGLPHTIVRLFNVYGPKNDFMRLHPPLVPYIVRELLNVKSPVLHGSGDQRRDYVYIDDLISLLLKIIENPVAKNNTYNASSNTTYSVNEIFEILGKCLNTTIRPVFRSEELFWDKFPSLQNGFNCELLTREVNKHTCGSFDKAYSDLGWRPTVSMEDGLMRTAAYIKLNL